MSVARLAPAVRALFAALLLALVLAVPAPAAPLFDPGDDAEVAQTLADAFEEQGVCYAYAVTVDDQSTGTSGTELGSHLGPGRDFDPASCPKSVRLTGTVTYTCDACESEDSAFASVESTGITPPIALEELGDLGLDDAQLAADNGDVELASMIEALPLLVASRGAAAPVPAELGQPGPAPNGDRPDSGSPIPDALRENAGVLFLCLLIAAAGLIWFFRAPRASGPPGPARRPPSATRPTAG